MRLGLLPSQQRALDQAFKKARAFDTFRSRTRRSMLAAAAAGLVTSVASFFVGQSTADESSQRRPDHPMDALALGEIDRLEARALDLLAEAETGRATPITWIGVERLLLRAISDDSKRSLRTRLLALRSLPDLPKAVSMALNSLAAQTRPR